MNKKTVILILIIVGIAALSFAALKLININQGPKKYVVIIADGKEYAKVPIDKDQIITVESSHGKNVIEIVSSSVHMLEASCPDQVCKGFGYIYQDDANSVFKKIICLPNEVLVEVVSDEIDSEINDLDIITN